MKTKKDSIVVYAVYWIDAHYSDDGDNSVKPIKAVTFGALHEKGEDWMSLAGEVFEDKTRRRIMAIDGLSIKKIVKVGPAPSIEEVYGE